MHTNPLMVAELARLTIDARIRAARQGSRRVADRPEVRRHLLRPHLR
jgi:hypothetical protein